MPLKVVRREGTKTLYIHGTVRGQRVRESTGTDLQDQAEAYRAKREAEIWANSVYGTKATVTFAKAVNSYLSTETRSKTTAYFVDRLLEHFGPMRLQDIGQEVLDHAYAQILLPGASNATKLRGVLGPLKAILEHAAVRKWCDRPAFETPEQPKSHTTALKPDEATAVVQSFANHGRALVVFGFGTGCRMSEMLELDWAAVDLRGARARVWQKQKTFREVDLAPVVVAALSALPHREGRVFRPPPRRQAGRMVQPEGYYDNGRTAGGQISTAWAGACRRAGLPGKWRIWTPTGRNRPMRAWVPDQTPHDMRHTWASWHYAAHKDLLRLKHDGGWESVKMVERYAHLMPGAYREEIVAWWQGGVAEVRAAG